MLLRQIISLIITLLVCTISCGRVHLTCAQRKAFVDGHNVRRQKVAQGLVPRQPSAGDMMYMVWDEELAEKAARWAEHGLFAHNPDRSIGSQRWKLVGENIYTSSYCTNRDYAVDVTPDIDEALETWFTEHENYGFEPFVLGTPKAIGHYTQMVWADTTRVGCGIAQRKVNDCTHTLYVCDYGPTGNWLGQRPYKSNGWTRYLRCEKSACHKPYGFYC